MNESQLKKLIAEEIKKVLSEMQDIKCRLDEKQLYYYEEGLAIVRNPKLFLSKLNMLEKNVQEVNNWDVYQYLRAYAIYYRCYKEGDNQLEKICREAQNIIKKKYPKTLKQGSPEQILFMNLDILIGASNYSIYPTINKAEQHCSKMKAIQF